MLTVKHITLSGEEFIYPTGHVNFVPGRAKGRLAGCTGRRIELAEEPDSLWIEWPAGTRFEITGGTVFVMNAGGKTVSRYDLGASPVGFDVNPLHSAARTGHGGGVQIE